MKLYGSNAIGQALEMLANHGYDIVTIEEGCLGYGHIIALAPDDNHYNVEIQEKALNEWSSGHTVRNFAKISKRIENLLANA